ncbi:uncharacterized protein LOC123566324 [Mercenaria mercenaria]|uniref:uncharacterized protein LOC123566324 n=1 Tax=Mercenaria mercenaria TaxID=6596 RepID=UPI00234EDF7B|nr:uncharacterized protein LOC123566324 [Mercenaria mercenaria]
MTAENSCKCCSSLYSLAAECLVVTLTLVHVLLSAAELMIHLQVIQVPASGSEDNTGIEINETTLPPATPSQSYDPGGCDNSLHPHLSDTVAIVRYATLVISAVFFIEIVCKVLYLKVKFLKDIWQMFDMLIVLLSLGVEIGFFLVHEKLVCYSSATEAATFVIVLRLWRIPRACNIRKAEYKKKLEDQHHFLRLTKTETEKRCKELEKIVQSQSEEIEKYKAVIRKNNSVVKDENERVANGNGPFNKGISAAAIGILHPDARENSDRVNSVQTERLRSEVNNDEIRDNAKCSENNASNKTESDLERNDSDKNSRANDSGIEVKDSFRSEKEVTRVYDKVQNSDDEVFDSDGSEFPVAVQVQEVEVQIEEISRQKQLPSVTSIPRSPGDEDHEAVLLRRKSSKTMAAAFINPSFDNDEPDARGTYRSADGIPMTEL